MSKAKHSIDERLAAQQEIMKRAKAQIKKLEQKQKEDERKSRTKRLISIGAEVECFAGCQITNLEAFKVFLKQAGPYIANTQKPNGSNDTKVPSTSQKNNTNNQNTTGASTGGIQYNAVTPNA